LRSGVLLGPIGAAHLLLALAHVDERAVLLYGLLGRVDLAEAALATDWLSCCELRALLADSGFLLGSPGLLAALALGFLLGEVALDRGWRGRCASLPSTFDPAST
jgi:hypothetical protein